MRFQWRRLVTRSRQRGYTQRLKKVGEKYEGLNNKSEKLPLLFSAFLNARAERCFALLPEIYPYTDKK